MKECKHSVKVKKIEGNNRFLVRHDCTGEIVDGPFLHRDLAEARAAKRTKRVTAAYHRDDPAVEEEPPTEETPPAIEEEQAAGDTQPEASEPKAR